MVKKKEKQLKNNLHLAFNHRPFKSCKKHIYCICEVIRIDPNYKITSKNNSMVLIKSYGCNLGTKSEVIRLKKNSIKAFPLGQRLQALYGFMRERWCEESRGRFIAIAVSHQSHAYLQLRKAKMPL